jgi:hypothetical protein
MAFTFGVVLPNIVTLVIAGISTAIHLGVYPRVMKFWVRLRRV